jgi:hypothetical protein
MNEVVKEKRERHELWEQRRVLTLRSRRLSRDAKVHMAHMRHDSETNAKLHRIAEKSEKEYFALRMLQIEAAERTRILHSRNVQERETYVRRKSDDAEERAGVASSLLYATTYLISSRDQHCATSPRATRPAHNDVKITAERLESLCSPRLSWEDRLPPIQAARQQKEEHLAAHREQKRLAVMQRAMDREARRAEQHRRLEDVSLDQERRSHAIQTQHQQDDARVEHLAWKKRHPLRAEAIERLEKEEGEQERSKVPSPPVGPRKQGNGSEPLMKLSSEQDAIVADEHTKRQETAEEERDAREKAATLESSEAHQIRACEKKQAHDAEVLQRTEANERASLEKEEREQREKKKKQEDAEEQKLQRLHKERLAAVEDLIQEESAERCKKEKEESEKRQKKERAEYMQEKEKRQEEKKAKLAAQQAERDEIEERATVEKEEREQREKKKKQEDAEEQKLQRLHKERLAAVEDLIEEESAERSKKEKEESEKRQKKERAEYMQEKEKRQEEKKAKLAAQLAERDEIEARNSAALEEEAVDEPRLNSLPDVNDGRTDESPVKSDGDGQQKTDNAVSHVEEGEPPVSVSELQDDQ